MWGPLRENPLCWRSPSLWGATKRWDQEVVLHKTLTRPCPAAFLAKSLLRQDTSLIGEARSNHDDRQLHRHQQGSRRYSSDARQRPILRQAILHSFRCLAKRFHLALQAQRHFGHEAARSTLNSIRSPDDFRIWPSPKGQGSLQHSKARRRPLTDGQGWEGPFKGSLGRLCAEVGRRRKHVLSRSRLGLL